MSWKLIIQFGCLLAVALVSIGCARHRGQATAHILVSNGTVSVILSAAQATGVETAVKKAAHVAPTVPAEFHASNPAGTSVIELKVVADDRITAQALCDSWANYLAAKKQAAVKNVKPQVRILDRAVSGSAR